MALATMPQHYTTLDACIFQQSFEVGEGTYGHVYEAETMLPGLRCAVDSLEVAG